MLTELPASDIRYTSNNYISLCYPLSLQLRYGAIEYFSFYNIEPSKGVGKVNIGSKVLLWEKCRHLLKQALKSSKPGNRGSLGLRG